jgi:hypothetical protein
MAWPVTIKDSGGFPVSLSNKGVAATIMTTGGLPVTLCEYGTPMAFISTANAPKNAEALLGEATNGFAVDFTDGSLCIRDSGTPANDYSGLFGSKLTVTGTLTAGDSGAYFDTSNHATMALTAMPSIATVCTVWVEYMLPTLTGAIQTLVVADDGTTNNRHDVFVSAAGNMQTIMRTAAANEANFSGVAATAARIGRMAYASQVNNANAAFNGTIRPLDTACAVPVGLTTLRLGRSSAGEYADGRIRRVIILPTRKTDAWLAEKTFLVSG